MQWIPVEQRAFSSNLQLLQSKVIPLIDKHFHPTFVYQFDVKTTTRIPFNHLQNQQQSIDLLVAIISIPIYPVINPEFV